jgi:hypothetical protein
MYLYDDFDRTFLAERVAEFRVRSRAGSGELNEDEFKSLRLMNGVICSCVLHAAHRHSVRHACIRSDAQARPRGAPL